MTLVEAILENLYISRENEYVLLIVVVGLALFLGWCLGRAKDRRQVSTNGTAKPSVNSENVEVARIVVHPIKSCRGVSVSSSRYNEEGLYYDRRWCLIDAETHKIVTGREAPIMVLITPFLVQDGPIKYLGISFPESSNCDTFMVHLEPSKEILQKWTLIDSSLWGESVDGYICQDLRTWEGPSDETRLKWPLPSIVLSKFLGRQVHLVYQGPKTRACEVTPLFPNLKGTIIGFVDAYPLLTMSEESIEELNRRVPAYAGREGIHERWKTEKAQIERYRPNIIFRGGGAFSEDLWEEVEIRSQKDGTVHRVSLVEPCWRCTLPNVSPDSGVADKNMPQKVLMKFRTGVSKAMPTKACNGAWSVPHGEGEVRVGDKVFVKKFVEK